MISPAHQKATQMTLYILFQQERTPFFPWEHSRLRIWPQGLWCFETILQRAAFCHFWWESYWQCNKVLEFGKHLIILTQRSGYLRYLNISELLNRVSGALGVLGFYWLQTHLKQQLTTNLEITLLGQQSSTCCWMVDWKTVRAGSGGVWKGDGAEPEDCNWE